MDAKGLKSLLHKKLLFIATEQQRFGPHKDKENSTDQAVSHRKNILEPWYIRLICLKSEGLLQKPLYRQESSQARLSASPSPGRGWTWGSWGESPRKQKIKCLCFVWIDNDVSFSYGLITTNLGHINSSLIESWNKMVRSEHSCKQWEQEPPWWWLVLMLSKEGTQPPQTHTHTHTHKQCPMGSFLGPPLEFIGVPKLLFQTPRYPREGWNERNVLRVHPGSKGTTFISKSEKQVLSLTVQWWGNSLFPAKL